MTNALLIVPSFWDPICPPLGVSSLKSHAALRGHRVHCADLNTLGSVTRAQRAYFAEGRRQFPRWKDWNIERNGAEALALHQALYLKARGRAGYADMVAEVLNLALEPEGEFRDRLDVSAFDAIFDRVYARLGDAVDRLLDEHRPEVIGCTVNSTTWPCATFVLERARRRLPGVRTVVGGPGPMMGIASRASEVSTFYESLDCLDHYVVGEGEEAFVEILEEPEREPGIIDREGGLELEEAKRRSVDVRALAAPDYADLDLRKYLLLSVATSRGCPFECSFCAETVFWKGFRHRRGDDALEHIDELARAHDRGAFFLCDSLANQVIGPLTAAVEQRDLPYRFDCYLRADEICTDEERVGRWKGGGLFRARIGLESASQRILDAMVKMTNPERIERSLHALSSAGVMTSTMWIINFPGETEEEFAESVRFATENADRIFQADAAVYQFHPEGLAGSDAVTAAHSSQFRFSSAVNDVLAIAPHRVARDYSPADSFERLERWTASMRELGIPNPYTLDEWERAEQRWSALGRRSGWSPRSSRRRIIGV